MKGLIIKDLLQLKSYLKTLIIFMVVFVLISIEPQNLNTDGILIIMMALGLGMFGMATFSYDEMAKADRYILTMPFTRKEIVFSKYILLFSLTLIGSILGTILNIIISLILKNSIPDIGDLITMSLGAVFGIGLVQSIYIPSIYKFGSEKGRICVFIGTIIVAFLLGGVVTLGEKVLSNFSIDFSFLNNILDSYIIFILLGIILITYFISYKISYKIYSKKEL